MVEIAVPLYVRICAGIVISLNLDATTRLWVCRFVQLETWNDEHIHHHHLITQLL